MSEEILISAATPVLKAIAPQALTLLSQLTSLGLAKVRANLRSTFAHHLELTYERCANVKTLFSDDRSIPLSSIYVNMYLKSANLTLRDEDLVDDTAVTKRSVIIGTGGAGKTMIMRYLALAHYSKPNGSIPLFIELRNLKDPSSTDFIECVFKMIAPSSAHDSLHIFKEGLRAGVFTLFLDGLDEVPPDYREIVFRNIQRIPIDYPSTKIIASTRPEIDVSPWEVFTKYNVKGLTKSQANLLISKVPFDVESKAAFLSALGSGLYEQHQTFMSVPLLCALMLLTFHEFADIPSRVTVFYEQAFDALYRKHDSSKGPFKRRHATGLSVDRFRYLFSAFCYRTLALHEVSFSDDELRQHIMKASKVCEINIDLEDFASDLVSSVCLVMRDGLNLHFIHRSFQDYFAAIYVLRYRGSDSFDLANRIFTDTFISNALDMAIDLDAKAVEQMWGLPAIKRLDKRILSWPKSERWIKLLENTFYEIKVDDVDGKTIYGWSWTSNSLHNTISALSKLYPDEGLSLSSFSGSIVEVDHICDLATNFELPEDITEACRDWENRSSGQLVSDDGSVEPDESLEINVCDMPKGWLTASTMPANIEQLCVNLHNLKVKLDNRADRRNKLKLLN